MADPDPSLPADAAIPLPHKALRLLRVILRPWLDKVIGRPGTVSFAEWDAAMAELLLPPADVAIPPLDQLLERLRSCADPAGCTQEPINGARVECRAFHSDRLHRWCRSCVIQEVADKFTALLRGLARPGEPHAELLKEFFAQGWRAARDRADLSFEAVWAIMLNAPLFQERRTKCRCPLDGHEPNCQFAKVAEGRAPAGGARLEPPDDDYERVAMIASGEMPPNPTALDYVFAARCRLNPGSCDDFDKVVGLLIEAEKLLMADPGRLARPGIPLEDEDGERALSQGWFRRQVERTERDIQELPEWLGGKMESGTLAKLQAQMETLTRERNAAEDARDWECAGRETYHRRLGDAEDQLAALRTQIQQLPRLIVAHEGTWHEYVDYQQLKALLRPPQAPA